MMKKLGTVLTVSAEVQTGLAPVFESVLMPGRWVGADHDHDPLWC